MADLAEPAPLTTAQGSAISRFVQARPLTTFFVLTYLWSWALWETMALLPEGLSTSFEGVLEVIFIAGISGPTVGALVTSWLAYRSLKICRIWTGWRNLFAGLGFGLVGFFLTAVVLSSRAIAIAPFSAMHWTSLLHWSTYGINYSTWIGGPVNEEPGWRGFALPRLQEKYGPVRATLILAPLWMGWHLPLFQMPNWNSANPWQFLLILTGIAFLMTAAANLSRFNVIVAIVLHAFFNTSSAMSNALTHNLPTRMHEMTVYTLCVLVCGTFLGMAGLWWSRKRQPEPAS
jgi:membrane protease YdiL (CAAX protease family)